jgi:AAA domain-containing protein
MASEQRIIDLTFGAARRLDRASWTRSRSSCSPPGPDHPTSSAPPYTASSPARARRLLIAAAGRGKTYSLNLAREMWDGSGYRMIGASLAARAAKELEDQATSRHPRSPSD